MCAVKKAGFAVNICVFFIDIAENKCDRQTSLLVNIYIYMICILLATLNINKMHQTNSTVLHNFFKSY